MWSVQHSNPWRADTLLRAFITLSSTGMAEAEHSNDGSLILREPSADGEANGGPPSGAAPGKIFPVDSLVENLLPLPKATGSHREQMTAGIPRQRGVSAGVIFDSEALLILFPLLLSCLLLLLRFQTDCDGPARSRSWSSRRDMLRGFHSAIGTHLQPDFPDDGGAQTSAAKALKSAHSVAPRKRVPSPPYVTPRLSRTPARRPSARP